MLTCVNCGPDCDKETAKSPQTGDPFARMSRDLGVMRKLSNLQSDANLMCQSYQSQYTFNLKKKMCSPSLKLAFLPKRYNLMSIVEIWGLIHPYKTGL
jgi:hypothetical protein